ncbi:preprotein translocase subunit SecG [bacterium]|nr:MAG: preprotein translocase subunit SecG [bacterium]
MNIVYSVLVTIAVLIAIAFSLLVLITGKGDAMNGGGSVRTSFKGKASFDDIMSKWTLYFGVAFMALILVVDVLAKQLDRSNAAPVIERNVQTSSIPATNTAPAVNASPVVNAPTNTAAPATNVPAPTTGAGTTNVAPPVSNAPLDSSPATTPGIPTEPTVTPTVPGANAPSPTSGTTG